MKKLIALVALVALPACAPVLVAGLIHKNIKSKEARKEFTQQFRADNFEREQAGLTPLDWCQEVWRYDEGWANDLKECKDYVNFRGTYYEGNDSPPQ